MFKRCHSLKKSKLKIQCNLTNISVSRSSKSALSTEEDIDAGIYQSTYSFSSPKVDLVKSYEVSNLPGCSPRERKKPLNNLSNDVQMVNKIKRLCKDIEEMDKKIETYQAINERITVRHKK